MQDHHIYLTMFNEIRSFITKISVFFFSNIGSFTMHHNPKHRWAISMKRKKLSILSKKIIIVLMTIVIVLNKQCSSSNPSFESYSKTILNNLLQLKCHCVDVKRTFVKVNIKQKIRFHYFLYFYTPEIIRTLWNLKKYRTLKCLSRITFHENLISNLPINSGLETALYGCHWRGPLLLLENPVS